MESIYEEIDNDEENFDLEERRENYLSFFRRNFPFLVCPVLAEEGAKYLPDLNWKKVKYSNHANHEFPDKQGVYIFVVSFDNKNLPSNSYVMYVGKAGDTDSCNTIRKRFRDYVNKSGYYDRSRVKKLIKHFSEHLFYYYAEIPDGYSTAFVEKALANIFVPPCCQNDFSADLKSLLRGARIL